jgi:serine/threonine protein kinase
LGGKAIPITLDPAFSATHDPKLMRSEELTAAFLHDHEKSLVVAPTHFVVRETTAAASKDYLVAVGDKDFRAWAKHRLLQNSDASGKANPDYALAIVGQVQDKAKGVELFQFIEDYISNPGLKSPDHLNTIAIGLIDALKVLEQRGFVHGDLKFANIFYDEAGKKLSLIDTGGLSKVAKDPVERPNTYFRSGRGLTADYTIQSNGVMGVEQDIYAVGMMLLELSAYCEMTGAAQNDAADAIEAFKSAAKTHTLQAVSGHELSADARADVSALLDHYFPIAATKIQKAGIEAIKFAHFIADHRDDWNSAAKRSDLFSGLDYLRNIIGKA